MKNILFRALPVLSGALLCAVAHAQDAPARPTNPLNGMVTPLPVAPPAETLLALAKAADANVLADVDDVATPAVAPVSANREQTLFMALNSLTGTQEWSWRRNAEGTLLLWKSPDFVALARQISDANVASAKAAGATDAAKATDATKAPAVAAPQAEPLGVALTRYFAMPAAHNDPNNPAAWRAVPLSELPPELRDRIIEGARAGQQQDLQFAASSAVLSDEFWKTAVLKLREFNAPAPRVDQTVKRTPAEILAAAKAAPVHLQKYLFVAGDFKRDGGTATTMLSLGRWTPDAATP